MHKQENPPNTTLHGHTVYAHAEDAHEMYMCRCTYSVHTHCVNIHIIPNVASMALQNISYVSYFTRKNVDAKVLQK